MISASKVGWGILFNRLSLYSGKTEEFFSVNRIIFAIPKRFSLPMRIPIFGRCGYSTDQVVFQKSPASGAVFMLRTFSNLRSSLLRDRDFTHRKPSAIPPQTTQLPVEIAEGSIFTTASAYRTAGDVSMIDSLENFRIHVSCFPSGVYERQIL